MGAGDGHCSPPRSFSFGGWLPDSQGLITLKKRRLPSRYLRAPGSAEKCSTWLPGEGPADWLPSPSAQSCLAAGRAGARALWAPAPATHLDLPPRQTHCVGELGDSHSEQAQGTPWKKPPLECEVEYRWPWLGFCGTWGWEVGEPCVCCAVGVGEVLLLGGAGHSERASLAPAPPQPPPAPV